MVQEPKAQAQEPPNPSNAVGGVKAHGGVPLFAFANRFGAILREGAKQSGIYGFLVVRRLRSNLPIWGNAMGTNS